ncbi:MAG: SDR family oxidoreductase [bacterium]|nr:SDR family oxidoreductase [bacterium]
MSENRTGLEIAVIGMAGVFPGAKDIHAFWENLKNGVESVSFFSDDELLQAGVDPELLHNPNYVKSPGALLEDNARFDASFFGYLPHEAELMDPQIRLFHECTWHVLEDAGYDPQCYPGSIGLHAGAASSMYWEALVMSSGKADMVGDFAASQLYEKDFLCTRISYALNLKGPSVSINTACSTSLVAVHLACQSLLAGECDMAIAGGVSVSHFKRLGYLYQEGQILSPDGHCRAFDARAKGTIFGEGAGAVLLKPFEQAIADGDSIFAIIKGSAINNDGREKVGYTAPSVEGQAEVIRTAYLAAEVEPETLSYIEAHGTGTVLGDPIEVEALTQAFNTEKTGFCAIGSVKTNIGHLDTAAGIAGLIKAVLALQHKLLPPSLHFQAPNPEIDFARSPFYVNQTLTDWQNGHHPLRAGVSSLGIGGTNAHVVLEEVPEDCRLENETSQSTIDNRQSRPQHLILLSAKTPSALEKTAENFVEYLKTHADVNLADAAYTLQVGRGVFPYRRMCLCAETDEAIEKLSLSLARRETPRKTLTESPSVIFMFPGQGAQYVNMGLELYLHEPTFHKEMDRCSELLKPHLGYDLCAILYPETRTSHPDLHQTANTQPALFVIEYALAKLLMEWGIQPRAMIGHSFGEYVVACLAGVFSLEDALFLLAARAQLMQEMPSGSMLSVQLPEKEVLPLLSETLSLASVNAPSLCVVSGQSEKIEALQDSLTKDGIACTLLRTSHAFHSTMMEPVLDRFAQKVKSVTLNPPNFPYVSTVTGTWVTTEDVTSHTYWMNNIRQTVRFSDAVQQLLEKSHQIWLEIGPGRTLSSLVQRHINSAQKGVTLYSLPHPKEKHSAEAVLLKTLGKLWLVGIQVDWTGFYKHERRRRLSLPTYPFEGQRYWIEGNLLNLEAKTAVAEGTIKPNSVSESHSRRSDINHWLYMPEWEQTLPLNSQSKSDPFSSNWLIFVNDSHLVEQFLTSLERQQQRVITVKPGSQFTQLRKDEYIINPQQASDYEALFQSIESIPQSIVHLWSISAAHYDELNVNHVTSAQDSGFYSVLYIAQALGKVKRSREIQIHIVTNNLQEVTGEEIIQPEQAPLLGLVKVIPQEFPGIRCRNIDILVPQPESRQEQLLVSSLQTEIGTKISDTMLAYRGAHRWRQRFQPARLQQLLASPCLKSEGVYLITGGLGNLGLIFAEYLAKTVRAKLILTRRSFFPDRAEWKQWLDSHEQEDRTSQAIQKIRKIEQLGGQVLATQTDVSDVEQMRALILDAERQFEKLDGLIHAAGVLQGPSIDGIQGLGREECEIQFRSKVEGLLVLNHVLHDRKLDFCLLMSSLSSILGGPGLGAYAAANAFMDAFVRRQKQTSSLPWSSINWGYWNLSQDQNRQNSFRKNSEEFSLNVEEGIEVLTKLLSFPVLYRIIISPGNLHRRLTDMVLPYPPPQAAFDIVLTQIWKRFFGVEIGIHDNFFELGGDSLKMLTVVSHILKELNVEVSVAEFFKHPTIAELAQYIYSIQPGISSKNSSLVAIQSKGTTQPFFCVPGVGGNVGYFRDLANYIGMEQPFYGLQAIGFDGKSEPYTRVEDMASHYIEAIRERVPHGPYLLGGHSFGACVAFEMTRQLQEQDKEVALLAVFDVTAPLLEIEPDCASWDDARWLTEIAAIIGRVMQKDLSLSYNVLRSLGSEKQVQLLFEHLKRTGIIPAEAEITQVQNIIQVFKANMQARYTPKSISPIPIALFKARDGHPDDRETEEIPEILRNSEWGWERFAAGPVDIYEVPGDHISMVLEPHARALAEGLKNSIEKSCKIHSRQ